MEGRRTVGDAFIIKTNMGKYSRPRRVLMYTCFVQFEKSRDCIDRKTLWLKLRKVR
jgi:hypothetical protein